MYFKIVFFACLTFCADAKEEHDKRISGGNRAGLGQFPYQVLVEYRPLLIFRGICGGALVKENYVLTAAQCVKDRPMRVRAGLINIISLQGGFLDVASKSIHPSYNPDDSSNDIALLKLVNSYRLGDTIQLATLPQPNSIPTGQGVVAGWGSTGGFIDTLSNNLIYARFDILTQDACKTALGTKLAPRLKDSEVCAKSDNSNICEWDWGNPLVNNNVVVGIASWAGANCNKAGVPGVFTRVSNYTSWIDGVLKSP